MRFVRGSSQPKSESLLQELKDDTVHVRARGGASLGSMPLAAFTDLLCTQRAEKS
jgi:hypothetical protein